MTEVQLSPDPSQEAKTLGEVMSDAVATLSTSGRLNTDGSFANQHAMEEQTAEVSEQLGRVFEGVLCKDFGFSQSHASGLDRNILQIIDEVVSQTVQDVRNSEDRQRILDTVFRRSGVSNENIQIFIAEYVGYKLDLIFHYRGLLPGAKAIDGKNERDDAHDAQPSTSAPPTRKNRGPLLSGVVATVAGAATLAQHAVHSLDRVGDTISTATRYLNEKPTVLPPSERREVESRGRQIHWLPDGTDGQAGTAIDQDGNWYHHGVWITPDGKRYFYPERDGANREEPILRIGRDGKRKPLEVPVPWSVHQKYKEIQKERKVVERYARDIEKALRHPDSRYAKHGTQQAILKFYQRYDPEYKAPKPKEWDDWWGKIGPRCDAEFAAIEAGREEARQNGTSFHEWLVRRLQEQKEALSQGPRLWGEDPDATLPGSFVIQPSDPTLPLNKAAMSDPARTNPASPSRLKVEVSDPSREIPEEEFKVWATNIESALRAVKVGDSLSLDAAQRQIWEVYRRIEPSFFNVTDYERLPANVLKQLQDQYKQLRDDYIELQSNFHDALVVGLKKYATDHGVIITPSEPSDTSNADAAGGDVPTEARTLAGSVIRVPHPGGDLGGIDIFHDKASVAPQGMHEAAVDLVGELKGTGLVHAIYTQGVGQIFGCAAVTSRAYSFSGEGQYPGEYFQKGEYTHSKDWKDKDVLDNFHNDMPRPLLNWQHDPRMPEGDYRIERTTEVVAIGNPNAYAPRNKGFLETNFPNGASQMDFYIPVRGSNRRDRIVITLLIPKYIGERIMHEIRQNPYTVRALEDALFSILPQKEQEQIEKGPRLGRETMKHVKIIDMRTNPVAQGEVVDYPNAILGVPREGIE